MKPTSLTLTPAGLAFDTYDSDTVRREIKCWSSHSPILFRFVCITSARRQGNMGEQYKFKRHVNPLPSAVQGYTLSRHPG